jgi:hypothetical protein
MENCAHCHKPLLKNARFCHHCGARVEEAKKISAGPQEIANRFFTLLKQMVREEQDESSYEKYLQRFRESEFSQSFDTRMEQLAQTPGNLDETLEEMCDFFMIRHCRDLHVNPIPEIILRYQQTDPAKTDLYQMMMDYLQFSEEADTVYSNLLDMPVDKLRNASQAFLFPQKNERIFFICDLSLLGSCKEGFAMTEKALYWKAPLEKPRAVFYANLEEIAREKEWIRINGYFFNARKTLNIRMLKLLRKLRRY